MMCICSLTIYVYSFFRIIHSLESISSEIPIELDIEIQNINRRQFGYQCQFEVLKSTDLTELSKYKGSFYIQEEALKRLLNESSLSDFTYITKKYRMIGRFEQDWYPDNPGEIHPLWYLIAQRSFGVFDYELIEELPSPVEKKVRQEKSWHQKSLQLRLKFQKHIDEGLLLCFRPLEYGLLKAMILGDKTMIDSDVSLMYARNGLAHILAISGLHIMIFIGCLEYILRIFGLSHKCRFWLIFLIGMGYLWMLGFLISAIRAMCMGLLLIMTRAYRQVYARQRIFFLVFCLFVILAPNTLFSISFILSFGAVFALFYIYPVIRKYYKEFRENILLYFVMDSMNISFSVMVITFPVLVYFFKGVSLSGFIVNIFVLPVVPLFYVSAMLSLFLSFVHQFIGRFMAGTTTIISSYMLMIMGLFDMTYGFVNMPALPIYKLILYYVTIITLIIFVYMKGENYD